MLEKRGEKDTVSLPAPSRATWEQHNPEISGGTRAAWPCPARGWDLGPSRAGAGPGPAVLGSRQESAAGSDKSRRPRLFALGSRWWRRKRSISSSPAGSSQPRHDLGRGEGAGESCLRESPSKAQGAGDLTAFASPPRQAPKCPSAAHGVAERCRGWRQRAGASRSKGLEARRKASCCLRV